MCQKEDIRLKRSGVPPTIERNSGAINATDKLLIIEYAAVTEILHPSKPATTGADVAVAVNTQIITACARISLTGRNAIYISALPIYLIASRK